MNFVIYLNNLKKEISEISAEDLQEYKKIEWDKACYIYAKSPSDSDLQKLLRVRDLFGYSGIDYPVTEEEIKLNRKVYDDKIKSIMLKVGSRVDSGEVLSHEEQELYKKEMTQALKVKQMDRAIYFWFIVFGVSAGLLAGLFLYGSLMF